MLSRRGKEKSRQRLPNRIWNSNFFYIFWGPHKFGNGRTSQKVSILARFFPPRNEWIDSNFSKVEQATRRISPCWWRFRDYFVNVPILTAISFKFGNHFQTLFDSLRFLIASKKGHWGHGKDFLWLGIKNHTPIRPFSMFFRRFFWHLKIHVCLLWFH